MLNPETTLEQRRILDIVSIGILILSFSSVIILAGCGGAPVGLLMILSLFMSFDTSVWSLPMIAMIAGWTGIGLLFGSILTCSKVYYLWVSKIALTALVVSWCCYLALSESGIPAFFSLILSVPFGFALWFRIRIMYQTIHQDWL